MVNHYSYCMNTAEETKKVPNSDVRYSVRGFMYLQLFICVEVAVLEPFFLSISEITGAWWWLACTRAFKALKYSLLAFICRTLSLCVFLHSRHQAFLPRQTCKAFGYSMRLLLESRQMMMNYLQLNAPRRILGKIRL